MPCTKPWLATLLLSVAASPAVAQQLLYELPSDGDVRVREEKIKPYGLEVDLYYSANTDLSTRPAVVFVFGFPDSALSVGPLRDYRQYQDWARLAAASGFVGVLYEVREPVRDLRAVMGFLAENSDELGVAPERIGLWAASGNGALALKYARSAWEPRPKALVAYYALMPTPDGHQGSLLSDMSERFGFALPPYAEGEEYPDDLPMYVVRAGRDTWTELLHSIDRFVELALEANLPVTLRNYTTGQHSFDVQDDTGETREIITDTIAFLARIFRR
jgi:acetyl esterase/lipase